MFDYNLRRLRREYVRNMPRVEMVFSFRIAFDLSVEAVNQMELVKTALKTFPKDSNGFVFTKVNYQFF